MFPRNRFGFFIWWHRVLLVMAARTVCSPQSRRPLENQQQENDTAAWYCKFGAKISKRLRLSDCQPIFHHKTNWRNCKHCADLNRLSSRRPASRTVWRHAWAIHTWPRRCGEVISPSYGSCGILGVIVDRFVPSTRRTFVEIPWWRGPGRRNVFGWLLAPKRRHHSTLRRRKHEKSSAFAPGKINVQRQNSHTCHLLSDEGSGQRRRAHCWWADCPLQTTATRPWTSIVGGQFEAFLLRGTFIHHVQWFNTCWIISPRDVVCWTARPDVEHAPTIIWWICPVVWKGPGIPTATRMGHWRFETHTPPDRWHF